MLFKVYAVTSAIITIFFLLQGSTVYHILQCLMFTIMSILIMRLKLFLTPQMCVLAGMVTSKKVCNCAKCQLINTSYLFKVFKLNTKQRYWIAGGIIGLASIAGFWNLNEQMVRIFNYHFSHIHQEFMILLTFYISQTIIGEYNNPEMEQLVRLTIIVFEVYMCCLVGVVD